MAAIICLLIVAGCAVLNTTPKPIIDGLIFRNLTGAIVHNVKAHVKKTSAYAECSPVLAGSECSTTFKAVPYRGNAITISWQQNGREYKTGEFYASLPRTVVPHINTKVLVNISPSGTAEARLVQ